MKTRAFWSALSLLAVVSDPVIAADGMPGEYNWTGAYVGADLGYGWSSGRVFEPDAPPGIFINVKPTTLNSNPDGGIIGPFAGYNWQSGNFVYGGEADFSASDVVGSTTVAPLMTALGPPSSFGAGSSLSVGRRTDWLSTLRGRIGYTATNRLLIYGTGGIALAEMHYEADTTFGPGLSVASNFDRTQLGWTAGGGLEYALCKNWAVRAEYSYYDLGSITAFASAPAFIRGLSIGSNFRSDTNVARIGFSYKFN